MLGTLLIYNASWRINNDALHHWLAFLFGLGHLVILLGGSLIIYPIAFFRGARMWEFLDRFVNVALPRVKDFRGVNPNSFDGHGNYSLGITEQIIFPEIDYDKIERVSGLNVAITTTARTDQEARSLLGRLGMPFRK